MKTNNKFFFGMIVVALLSLLITGCTTYSYTSRSTSIRPNTISSKSVGAEIDVDFSRKVTATSDAQVLKNDAINDAQYKCITENNIDVIVDPIYKFEFNMFQKKAYIATVTGYAGTYKKASVGVDAVVEKQYTIEDIEKFKLITDPSFYPYYYRKNQGNVTNYFINSDGTVSEAQPMSMMIQPTQVPEKAMKKAMSTKIYDYNKSKKLRDAGIGMFSAGVAELGILFPTLLACSNSSWREYDFYRDTWDAYGHSYSKEADEYYNKSIAQEITSWVFCGLGCVSIVSGIPMWAVGQHRMKNARAAQLSVGGTKDGLGMRLTF